MYNLLIVEDEWLELSALETILQNSNLNFSSIQTADNGDTVNAILETFVPDIVLMDIHVGVYNGLDLSTAILDLNPDARIIILTAYNQFSYAQKGVQIGVADYLLKPIDTDTLLSTIKKQIQTLDEQKLLALKYSRQNENLREIKTLFSSCLTSNIMNGLISPDLSSILSSMNIAHKSMFVFALSFSISVTDLTPAESLTVKKLIVDNILESPQNLYLFYDIISSDDIIFCCFDPHQTNPNTFAIAQYFRHQVISKLHIPIKIGISEVLTQLSDLNTAYRHAVLAKKIGTESINQYSDYWTLNSNDEIFDLDALVLVNYIVKNDMEKLSEYIKNAFPNYSNAEAPFSSLKTQCVRVWIDLISNLNHQVSLNAFSDKDIAQPILQLLNSGSIRDLSKSLLIACQNISETISNAIQNKSHYTVKRVQKYIATHFKEPLTLTSISDAMKISPYYLSHIFKDTCNTTLVEYINSTRINNAKQLLKDSKLAVQEISQETGFTDSNYFCRVFKKQTGITPSAFRSMNQ